MGSIVKKVGKVVKKVGKFVKKALPYIIIAAGIYFGVGAYGASLMGGGASAGSMAAFKTGLSGIGAKFGMNTMAAQGLSSTGGQLAGQAAAGVTPFSWVKGFRAHSTGQAATPMEGVMNASGGTGAAANSSVGGDVVLAQNPNIGSLGSVTNPATNPASKGGWFSNLSDMGQFGVIQAGTTLASAALVGNEPSDYNQKKVREIGVGGQVLDRKGNVREANMMNPNTALARVDQTYNTAQQNTQGLVMQKPQAELTAGPTPNNVGLIGRYS